MKTKTNRAFGIARLVLGLAVITCVSGFGGCADADTPDFESASLGTSLDEVKYGQCSSARGRTCTDLSYSDIPANGQFYLTDFVGEAMACPGMPYADGKWAYVADKARFGCGAKVKVEANGKSCIATVADCGPNKGVEKAAFNSQTCVDHFPVLDASPLISKYLFATSSAGWSDHFKVTVSQVDAKTESGCPGGSTASTDKDAGSNPPGTGTGGACLRDADCNNNSAGEGVVCKGGKCADGCRTSTDCANGGTCSTTDGTIGKCSDAPAALGTDCQSDSDCNKGGQGTGRVCSTSTKKCIVGCHAETDCGTGSVCDKSDGAHWRCAKRKTIGEKCTGDVECNGGIAGTQRICADNEKVCADRCRTNWDCGKDQKCGANKSCEYAPPAEQDAGVTSNCTFNYPSVSIKGITTPQAVKDAYANRGCSVSTPKCVIDTNNIVDAKTNQKLSYAHVNLSANFSLREMSYQSVASSPYVFVDPATIVGLQAMRTSYGKAITINSGYRSPIHQNKICRNMCGKASCAGTCALCSDHMAGKGADLKHSYPKCTFGRLACNPGKFHLIYNEAAGGDHLHLDMGSNPVCTYKSWPGGGCGSTGSEPTDPKPAGGTACLKHLDSLGVPYKKTTAKGVVDAVSLTGAVNGVTYSSGTSSTVSSQPMACEFVESLWELSGRLKNLGFKRVGTLGSYCYRCCCAWSSSNDCRSAGDPTPVCSKGFSNHSWGRALDIRYLEKNDGTVYDINSNTDWQKWTSKDTCGKGLAAQTGVSLELYGIACNVKDLFNNFLTPNYNSDHRNHWHVDIGTSGPPQGTTPKSLPLENIDTGDHEDVCGDGPGDFFPTQ